MKKLSEMTKEEANNFVASAVDMFKANTKEIDDGYVPYISDEDAKALKAWEDNGKKGEPPITYVKWRKNE